MANTGTKSAGGKTLYVSYSTSQSNDKVTIRGYEVWFNSSGSLPSRVTLQMTVGSATSTDTVYPEVWEDGGSYFGAGVGTSTSVSRQHYSSSAYCQFKVTFTLNGSTYSATFDSVSISIPTKTSYTVSYYANGGSGAPSSQTKWYGETLTLTSSKPTRTSYVFWYWNTSSSNSGTSYSSGGSYTDNSSMSLYAIWNPVISYDGRGGSNVPTSQTKTYGQSLTLSSKVPTRAGYQFMGWATSSSSSTASYQPGGAYTSNSAITLYAIWRKVAEPPTISSMSVVRCISDGTPNDNGTYAKVTVGWSVDTTSAGMESNTGVVTGQILAQGSYTPTPITFSSGAIGTSGTAVAIVPNCDTDTQYTVTVTVTNTAIGTGQSTYLSTSRADILTRAFFTMDFAAGGRGIGMGTAAPLEGFECGFDAQFDGDLEVLGDLVAPNLTVVQETGTDVASSSGTWGMTAASTYGSKYGRIVHVSLCAVTGSSLTAGTEYQIGTLTSDYRPAHDIGWACRYGVGGITSGGYIYFRPTTSVSSSTTIYVSATYVK